jgi:hypothetical protein
MSARCTATSKQSAQRCRRAPIPGGRVCKMHGGAAPQVQRTAQERLAALVDPAIDALDYLIRRRDSPRAVLGAAKDVLDRTIGKPAQAIELTGTLHDLRSRLAGMGTRADRLAELLARRDLSLTESAELRELRVEAGLEAA